MIISGRGRSSMASTRLAALIFSPSPPKISMSCSRLCTDRFWPAASVSLPGVFAGCLEPDWPGFAVGAGEADGVLLSFFAEEPAVLESEASWLLLADPSLASPAAASGAPLSASELLCASPPLGLPVPDPEPTIADSVLSADC